MKLKLIYLLILTLTTATMAQERQGSALVITGATLIDGNGGIPILTPS